MRLRLLVLVAVLAVGCRGDQSDASGDTIADSVRAPADTERASHQEADVGSSESAVAVIRDYYAAIAAGDYARAYGHWSGEGEASGQTLEDFRSGYRETATVEAETGEPGRIDPAAGSRYIEIPVAVRATTTGGAAQCFRGTYFLRRSEVTGATAAQRRWHIASADLERRAPAECAPGRAVAASVRDSIVDLVTSFSQRLRNVSLLAPPEVVVRDLRAQYGPLVTRELLDEWRGDPSDAPGRKVSSPWPDRIEVSGVAHVAGGRYSVTGEVVYVTGAEVRDGGAADRRPVRLEVTRAAEGWRIAGYVEE